MTCACGLSKPHYVCKGCGMHNAVDHVPCIACTYFRFDPVAVAAPEAPVMAPKPASNTKRRPRGAALSTQRE